MPEKRKSELDARRLIAKLSKESAAVQQREIIAPLLPGSSIRTRLSGMIHEFKPQSKFVGWGRFRPVNEREVEVLGEALPWERSSYLELFPALRIVLLWPASATMPPGTWWALAFNESDARQRFGLSAEPLPVCLCDPTNGAERFERSIARVDGSMFWFDGPDLAADPTHAEWLRDAASKGEDTDTFLPGLAGSERLALLFWRIHQFEIALEPERRRRAEAEQGIERGRQAEVLRHNRKQQREWLRQEARRGTLEEQLRHALTKADATLHSFSELPNADGSSGHLVVEWSENGQRRRYRSTLDTRLSVVASGICLSGRDRDFDLTSLVSVMTDSP